MRASTLLLVAFTVAVLGLGASCSSPDPVDPIERASIDFKARPGFRTKETEILLPLITNGTRKVDVKRLLGEPDRRGSTSGYWFYTVFYSQALGVRFADDKVVSVTAIGFKADGE